MVERGPRVRGWSRGGRLARRRATRPRARDCSASRPLAAVPYADALDARCGGCIRRATPRGDATGAASRERASDARAKRERRTRASATPCAASRRTTRGSPRAHGSSAPPATPRAPIAAPRLDADADDANLDPAAEAAARDGDVIVDDYDAVLELMSGLQGGDDGLLSDDAVATLHEVAKQCKYLVDPQLRASTDEYVALLGRLQLNGFELTAAEASAETAGKHAPIGVGVFPSAARFNHSCEANAEQRFDKHGCIVVETRRAVPRGRS